MGKGIPKAFVITLIDFRADKDEYQIIAVCYNQDYAKKIFDKTVETQLGLSKTAEHFDEFIKFIGITDFDVIDRILELCDRGNLKQAYWVAGTYGKEIEVKTIRI